MPEENTIQDTLQGGSQFLSAPNHSSSSESPVLLPQGEARPHLFLQLLSNLLQGSDDPGQIELSLFEQLCQIVDAPIGLFFAWDDEAGEWSIRYHRGMPKDFAKNGHMSRAWQSLPTIIVQEGGALFSSDLSKDTRFVGQIIKSFRVKSFAGVALRASEKLVGVIGLGFSDPSGMSLADENGIRQVGSLAGMILERAVLAQKTSVIENGERPETLSESIASAEPTMSWTTNLDGKILLADAGAVSFLGYPREQLVKMYLSALISRKTAHLLLQTRGKRGTNSVGTTAPVEVEIKRYGKGSATLSVEVKRLRYHGRPALRFSAQNVTSPEKIEGELAQRSQQIEILEAIFENLSHTYTLEDVFWVILNKLLDLLGFEGGYLLHFDERKQRLFLSVQRGVSSERVNRLTKQGLRKGEGIPGRVMKEGEPYFITAGTRPDFLKKKIVGADGLRTYACVPIPLQGQLWGVLSVFSTMKSLDREALRWVTSVGRAIGYAVENATLFEESWRRVDDLMIMNEISQSITRSLHLEVLLGTVVDCFARTINAANCFIFLLEDKRNVLYGVAASGRHNTSIKKTEIKMNENSLAVLAVKEKRTFAIQNVSKDPRAHKKLVEQFKEKSLLCVPLAIKEKVIGVVVIDETRYYRTFSEEEIKRVGALANQVAVAIENATLYQSVTKHIERLQALSSAIVNIQEEERRRIARQLHDESGNALTNIKASLEMIEKELIGMSGSSTERVVERITGIKSQVVKTIDDFHRLSSDLRPAMLDDRGLIATLRWYVKDFSKRTGISVHLNTAEQQKRFSPKIEILFYRVVQEALTNVAKHAHAESVAINLEKKDVMATLYITDDGKGFAVKRYFSATPGSPRGFGVLGMKERVELNGGTFFIDSEPGEGTRISIRVPIMRRS